MRLNPLFEIVDVAGEYLAIPVGEASTKMQGVIALNEATAYLLKQMKTPTTEDELIQLLISEYEIDEITAQKDIDKVLHTLSDIGVVID